MSSPLDLFLAQLFSGRQLDRDRALSAIKAGTISGGVSAEVLLPELTRRLRDPASRPWEEMLGSLLGSAACLAAALTPAVPEALALDAAVGLGGSCTLMLKNPEARVRAATGELLYALCARLGVVVWTGATSSHLPAIGDGVLATLEESLDRVNLPDPEKFPDERSGRPMTPAEIALGIRHDAEGWRACETSLKVMARMIEGCGDAFVPLVTEELLGLTKRTYAHANRFVREAGFAAFGALCAIGDREHVERVAGRFAKDLAAGLADQWSPVRFAASVATRKFLEHSREVGERYYSLLLPRMCLNRCYVAEGVKLFSQQTWREIVGMRGKELLVQFMPETVEYYLEAAVAENHAVREAAFMCMGELMSRLDPDAVRPHVPRLVDSLASSFKDASWPVRDMACLASSQAVLAFPAEFAPRLAEFTEIWKHHLADHVWSVRENSAVGLANAAKAYGAPALETARAILREAIRKGFDQPADEHLDKDGAVFDEAAKRARDNDPVLHTGQQVFSCCSLATSPGGHAGPGHGQPWEAAAGGLYLLRELAPLDRSLAEELVPDVIRLAARCNYAHHHVFKETAFSQLPQILAQLPENSSISDTSGGSASLLLLATLAGGLHAAVAGTNRLAANAAGFCVRELRKSKLLGPTWDKALTEEQRAFFATNRYTKD
jgi:hypothetical protein